MKKLRFTAFLTATVLLMASCTSIMTRTEIDLHTITEKDTTYNITNQNAPGNRDNGVIYPSSRVLEFNRVTMTRDSLVVREYPDFIRFGVFESVGLMFTGEKEYALGTGMFGIFPDFSKVNTNFDANDNSVFRGGLYRFGIGEWRLRWFRDAKNWTYGTSVMEIIAPDSRLKNTLMSVFPIYVRKRFFLREEIPYVALTPAFGFGWYPSQYINLSGSIEAGSIGGFNLRAYLGLAIGVNQEWSPQIRSFKTSGTKTSSSVVAPYFGIGISFLDFVNIVPETYKEWKDHEHSSWNLGVLQVGLLSAPGTDSTALTESDENTIITGFSLRLLHGEVALPFLNNQFYAGTSLINLMVLGDNEWGMGILPIRLGYWQTVIEDELSVDPFIEYNYYPSGFLHIGAKLNLKISNEFNFSFNLGYVTGSKSTDYGTDATDAFGESNKISNFYFGISFGFLDRIFFPQELRYNK